MKNIIGILIVLSLLTGFIFYFTEDSKPTIIEDTETSKIEEETTIEKENTQMEEDLEEQGDTEESVVSDDILQIFYTDEGFEPSLAEVKKGEKVMFINQSSQNMWVGSDPHPTHSNYPEFDQKNMVANGGVFEFIFQKAGTWGYHNHINSNARGTIIVK